MGSGSQSNPFLGKSLNSITASSLDVRCAFVLASVSEDTYQAVRGTMAAWASEVPRKDYIPK